VRLREERERHKGLLRELARIDPDEERALADEWIDGETL
jgi:hypothetical protein